MATNPFQIGVLGDGQLARMLVLAAQNFGVAPVVIGQKDSPAGSVCPELIEGSFKNPQDLRAFSKICDHLVIESEFVDTNILREPVIAEKLIPKVETISVLQNKWEQKKLLKSLGIATSRAVALKDDIPTSLAQNFPNANYVLKFATLGYDGHGVYLSRGNLSEALQFCGRAQERQIAIFAEEKIHFAQELALVACFDRHGGSVFYPLVISQQDHGICDLVYGPATRFGVAATIERNAQEYAQKIARALNYVGILAIEFFLTQDGQLLVNELAPRVHNSGHYSQNACNVSQFENHIRAVLDVPLTTPVSAPFFAMINLLGPDTDAVHFSLPPLTKDMHLHWYQKKEFRPRRKMGHINLVSDKVDLAHLQTLKETRELWLKKITQTP